MPDVLTVGAEAADVVVHHGDAESRNGTSGILDEDDGRPFTQRLVTATRAVLAHVQDVAATASATPWPATGSSLPRAHAEVVDGYLRAWFGDADRPVLVLDPIAVTSFDDVRSDI